MTSVSELPVQEPRAVFRSSTHHQLLSGMLPHLDGRPLVVDISVLTKRLLLLLLRWLDDHDYWEKTWVVYSEPEAYEIEGQLPLSFGISRIAQIPGFPASPNPSRPLHAAMLLGYEGERAFSTYGILEPKKTTVIIPDPPFRESWRGRTQSQNRNLLAAMDCDAVRKADALDPDSTYAVLCGELGDPKERSEFSRSICPLGTKPQTVGVYMYARDCVDPPALIYTGPLRHNHKYYSSGVGQKWLIHKPQ